MQHLSLVDVGPQLLLLGIALLQAELFYEGVIISVGERFSLGALAVLFKT